VVHGKNLCVLIFEETASETESLASLLYASRYPLRMNQVRETGKLKTVPEAVIHEDIRLCRAREASPDYVSETA
jgi:hypothetical protein